tara:strand:- start:133 stop:294 length:162 start_codon:yes stop_codon:yes gene_type:complete
MDIAQIINSPIFWVLVASASELIALNPKLKSNSVVQLLMSGIKAAKPKGIKRR